MKKVRKVFGIVLCMALLLTAVSFAKPVTVEAAASPSKITVVKTVSWAKGASITIENNTAKTMYVEVDGGYAAKDGKTIAIPKGCKKTFSYKAFSCKGASFRLYISYTGKYNQPYYMYTTNCKPV